MNETMKMKRDAAAKDISAAYYANVPQKRITRQDIDARTVVMLNEFQEYVYEHCHDMPYENTVELAKELAVEVYYDVDRMCRYRGVTYKNRIRRTIRQLIRRYDGKIKTPSESVDKVVTRLMLEMSTIETMCTKFIDER